MALLNGKTVDFSGLSSSQVGEMLLEASSSGNGKGIILELTDEEEQAFVSSAGLIRGINVGRYFFDSIVDAATAKTGRRPTPNDLGYIYDSKKLTTIP